MRAGDILTGDVHLARRLNRNAVLKLIRERGPISRTALARATNLTPATTFSIVEELVSEDLVQEAGIGPSEGGRRPKLFEFNPQSYGVIGINIRTLEVVGLLTDLEARPLLTVARSYDPNSDVDMMALTGEVIEELLARSPFPKERLMGVGLAIPGLVDPEQGIVVRADKWKWQDLPLRDLLAQRLDLPVYIDVDEKALAVGEKFFGAGIGIPNVICIKLGRGFGSAAGVIANDTLIRGSDNMAGEMPHILVDPEGPRCYCGNYGCLEALVSPSAITRRAMRGLKLGAASSLVDRVDGDLDRITVDMIGEAATEGDPFALQIMQETGAYLGIAVATMVNLLNPDRVIIWGDDIRAESPLLEPIRRVVKQRTNPLPAEHAEIVAAELGAEAAAIGAATLVMIWKGALPARGYIGQPRC